MKKTTVAHLMVERMSESEKSFQIPDEIKGDLLKEHNWLLFDTNGPGLMSLKRKLFHEVCDEVDKLLESGEIVFNSEDGTITFI